MTGPLEGIRIIEVADWIMVPSACALLCDWGAEVIKVETSAGDPMRGFLQVGGTEGIDMTVIQFEQLNRGKKSVVADLREASGRERLHALAASADVVVTSLLPATRERFGMDVGTLRAVQPSIIVASSSGTGLEGPEAARGGFDYATFWARSGLAHSYHHPDLEYPVGVGGGMGDLISGVALAGAVSTAIAQRAMTGTAPTVDVSLLGTGLWLTAFDVLAAKHGVRKRLLATQAHHEPLLPLVNYYRTADGRFIVITIPKVAAAWSELCHRIGRPELATDSRFDTDRAQSKHRGELVTLLDAAFAEQTVDAWRQKLEGAGFVWSVAQRPIEVADDPQVLANGMVRAVEVTGDSKPRLPELVASYATFGRLKPALRPSPSLGEHTQQVLASLGVETDSE